MNTLLEAGGLRADELGDVDLFGSLHHLLVGDPLCAEADVLADSSGEEEGILENDAEAATEIGEGAR